jgi:hypothetical protein
LAFSCGMHQSASALRCRSLYDTYRGAGFNLVAFPCNQVPAQTPPAQRFRECLAQEAAMPVFVPQHVARSLTCPTRAQEHLHGYTGHIKAELNAANCSRFCTLSALLTLCAACASRARPQSPPFDACSLEGRRQGHRRKSGKRPSVSLALSSMSWCAATTLHSGALLIAIMRWWPHTHPRRYLGHLPLADLRGAECPARRLSCSWQRHPKASTWAAAALEHKPLQ